MDEEIEKPFPIEFIVILLIIAVANDVAQVFFLLLDFTGVGISGEAVMEPINAVLDFFFMGVFIWRVGWKGGTISQYIGSPLQLLLVPARTASVWIGIQKANHPNSLIGRVAGMAEAVEGGNIQGALGEAEGVAGNRIMGAEKKSQGGGTSVTRADGEAELKTANGANTAPGSESPGENVFKNPYENPMGTAGEELNEPPEEEFHEGEGLKKENGPEEEDAQPKKVIDIASRQKQRPDEDLAEAA